MASTSKPPILDVLEHYGASLPYFRGGWHPMHCPFHTDKRTSASVNVDEGVFKCFVCTDDTGDALAGDSYSIVMKVEGVDFAEAKRRIQEWTGFSSGDFSPGNHAERSFLPAWTRAKQGGNSRVQAWHRNGRG